MSRFEHLTCPRCGSKNVSPHADTLPAEGEADRWAPVRDEGYLCGDCELLESCLSNAKEAYVAFRNRWNDPIERVSAAELNAWYEERDRLEAERDRAWTWPAESERGIHDRAWRAAKLAEYASERRYRHTEIVGDQLEFSRLPQIPVNEALFAQIVTSPDDVAPRRAYAAWLRTQDHPVANDAAAFILEQLRLAESFARDPRADIRNTLSKRPFYTREPQPDDAPDQNWWRCASGEVVEMFCGRTRVLSEVGLISDRQSFRGFTEHVAIKAARFLEIADELYSLAPIRQLTITYCKGPDHGDTGLLQALLASPHLDRIRALKLPVRRFGRDKGDATVLNRLTDADLELLAASSHLRGLAYLDLQDQRQLSIRAFDALAGSPNLPALSAVLHDINRYWYPGTFTFGTMGPQKRELLDRPLATYRAELERRHGHVPWLHVADNYGSETPDVEAVIEHPVAR